MNKGKLARSWLLLVGSTVGFVLFVLLVPERGTQAGQAAWQYFMEMLQILPAVLVLMGLFSVWVSQDLVVRYLGSGSGLRGMGLSILLGTLPTGPLYVAFPMTDMLLKKGASLKNVVAFLSAWACIKVPQELVELKFLGPEFMGLRLGLTVVFVALMGWTIEEIVNRSEGRSAG
ncbi:MAG: permease [Candidatus Bipolaricaulota bacterium]